MNTLQQRVLKLEAQMNAMTQAWIYLASLVEMEGGMDVTRMEACLRRKRWATAPDINPEARELLRWMCDQLDEGRENRGRTGWNSAAAEQ